MVELAYSVPAVLSRLLVQTADALVSAMVNFVPGFLAAAIVAIAGWILGIFISEVLKRALILSKFEKMLEKYRVHEALGDVSISNVFVKSVKYYILLLFLSQAVRFLSLGVITSFVDSVLLFAPLVIAAMLIFSVAALLAMYLKERLLLIKPSSILVQQTSTGVRLLILYLGAITALNTVGIDTSFVNEFVLTVVQGISWGIAAAFAIAFGLGGQHEARTIITKLKKMEL